MGWRLFFIGMLLPPGLMIVYGQSTRPVLGMLLAGMYVLLYLASFWIMGQNGRRGND